MDGLGALDGSAGITLKSADEPRGASSGPAPWWLWLSARFPDDRATTIAVLVMGGLLFLPFLGTLGLWDPWETHYGEVAREMIARDDYVYPHWESAYFFSKPALTLWLMAFGLLAVGAESGAPTEALGSWAEWGARLPFAFIAMLTLWAVYRIGRQMKDRTTGLLAAFVLASCPQFIFIGKQAMSDMPLVGMMTAALALFVAAVFDEQEDGPAEKPLRWITAGGISVATFVQLFLIGREMNAGLGLGLVIGAGALALAFAGYVLFAASRRDCWLAGFYVFMGLAALAKGLAVLAIVGPTVVLYMLLTLDFGILARSRVLAGGVLFLLVAAPWYLTLSMFQGRDDEGLTFTQRFWVHDNFSRVGAGVHGDRGGVGYYVEQLAYGMFPWVAVVPFAIGLAARQIQEDDVEVQRRRLKIFVLIWALWVYAFFTMSQTKFHHYVFPAVPAMAILVAGWLAWVAEAPQTRLRPAMAFVALVIFAVAGRDLINDPKNLVNLFTYKYDRDYPRDVVVRPFLSAFVALGGVSLLALSLPDSAALRRIGGGVLGRFTDSLRRNKGRALLGFIAAAGLMGAWVSHHHFNHLSPHWSQAHLFDTYYQERQGNEPIYAYQLNWRGETFYSRNRVLQVKERGANERMRQLVDQPGREFIITEQSRFHTLKSALSPDKREKLEIVDRSSNKFYLCVVED